MCLKLSQEQQKAVEGILEIFCKNTHKPAVAVLTGPAGSGKSTVVSQTVAHFEQTLGKKVILCASTHRAAYVMSQISNRDVLTAHNVFNVRPSFDNLGKETIYAGGSPNIPYGSIVIIDEATMLNNVFLQAISKIVTTYNLRILFVGDKLQLPPVSGVCSIFDGSLPTFELHTIHRQAQDNPILELASKFRDFIAGTITEFPTITTSLNTLGEGVHVIPHGDFTQKFVRKYINYETGDCVDTPMCTFTNESALIYNNLIRNSINFINGETAPYLAGERLVANSSVLEEDRLILLNNSEVIVRYYSSCEYHGIDGFWVRISEPDTYAHTKDRKTVFCPVDKAAANTVLDELKNNAKRSKSFKDWQKFYKIKNSIADLRPPFAGTIHKAQGGTFTSVFIDQNNIKKCKDNVLRARLLYVALTRAKKDVYINA